MSAFEKFDPYAFLQRERPPGTEVPDAERAINEAARPQTLAALATLAGLAAEIEISNSSKIANNSSDQWNKNQIQSPTPAKVAKVAKAGIAGSAAPFRSAFEALERSCPDLIEAERWQQAVEDGRRFLASWSDQAHALGWTAHELFGLHTPPERQAASYSRLSRYDEIGLFWLLRGRHVIALTERTAAIQGTTAVLTYRKLNKPALGPLGDSLDDMGPTP
jgi:hypothetical protein